VFGCHNIQHVGHHCEAQWFKCESDRFHMTSLCWQKCPSIAGEL